MPDALGGPPPRQGLGTVVATPDTQSVQTFSGGATQGVVYALVNNGGGPFGQINVGTVTYSAGSGWATASIVRAPSGHIGVQVLVDPTSMVAGDYTATIPVTVANATPGNLSLTLQVRVDSPTAVIVVSPQAGAIFADVAAGSIGTSEVQSFKITNGGPGFLAGPVNSAITYESGSGWLVMTQPVTDGAGGFDFTVDVTPGQLAAGDYRATFDITDVNAPGTVTFTVDMSLTAAPSPPTISVSPASFNFSAIQGDNQASTQTLTIANSGGGSLAVPTVTVSNAPWLTIGAVAPGSSGFTCTLTATTGGTTTGVYPVTVSVASVGASNTPLAVPVQFDVSAPPVLPVLAVSPSTRTFQTVEGGGNPGNQNVTAVNAGTGTLAGPTATKLGGASWLTVTRSGSGNSYTFACAVNNSGLLSASSPYTETVRITDANNTGSDQDVVVTVNVAASASTPRPAPPHTLPTGMSFNTTTGLPEGTPLQITYSSTPVTSWVNMETTPDALGRVMGSNAVTNAAILQRWLNDDAATNTRRGYTCDTSRRFTGTITSPHNAGAGWSALRPNGYTYDPTLKVPRTRASTAPTLEATGANQPAFRTSTSGARDSNHGRFAIMGFHVTHDTTTGGTLNAAISEGLVRLGQGFTQATLDRVPVGFLLHDCTVGGLAGRYLGRGIYADCSDLEIRAVTVTEVHRSWTNATDTGQIQDAQCLLGINMPGRWDCRYSIFHGGDECVNLGGGSVAIANLLPSDFFFGWCEFSADDAFLFNLSGTDGPANRLASDRWHKKNAYEQKTGSKVWHYACRYTGITEPNNNQGYLATAKTGAYGTTAPLQTSQDVCFQGGWFDRAPGMVGMSGYESTDNPPAPAVNAARVSMIDCVGWNLNKVLSSPTRDHQQTGKRAMFAHNISGQSFQATHGPVNVDNVIVDHVSCLTDSGSADGAFFAYYDTLPNLVVRNSIFPWCGHSILANNGIATTTLGTAALNNMSTSTWTGTHNTICPRSGYPSGYPTGMNWTAVADFATLGVADYANGDLRITGSYAAGGANQASDGWNRGLSDPDFWYTQWADTPTILASHPTVP